MSFLLAAIQTANTYPIPVKIIISFFAGLLPVLVWLWFWEHEDKHPEPHKLVALAFIAGMVSVIFALAFEQLACIYLVDNITTSCSPRPSPHIIFVWVIIEELLKFAAAYIFVLRRAENDEPIDNIMYMITVALGFSALENGLFFFSLMYDNQTLLALMNGTARFVGATLLHTITSGIIGLALAFAFYRDKQTRRMYAIIGVITAIILHAFFNLSIMTFEGSLFILPFYGVWLAIIALIFTFEKVKQLKA